MTTSNKILAYAYQFQEMFLSKDIFLIPYYISKELGGECKYLYTQNLGNTEIPKLHRGVIIERTKNKKGEADGLFLSSCYIPRGEYGGLSFDGRSF